MNRLSTAVLLLTLTFSTAALSKEVAGVKLPDTASVEGKTLKLKGAGLRKKVFFKVYVAGLYAENAGLDAKELVSSDQVKRVQLAMLRDVDRKAVGDAIREGFAKNNAAKMSALQARLDKFASGLPDTKSGDQLLFTYLPGKGLHVSGKNVDFTVEGKDFADALFSVWLGADPVDEGLKEGMLGKD
jgi:hypothetical protein